MRPERVRIDAASFVPPDTGDDPEDRLRAAVSAFIRMIIDTEPQQRTMLRLSLEPDTTPDELPLRKGRAIGWFEDALSPLESALTVPGVHRLAIAIRSAVGIEALVWLIDVGGLTRDDAAKTMEWSALALLRHAMADGPPISG